MRSVQTVSLKYNIIEISPHPYMCTISGSVNQHKQMYLDGVYDVRTGVGCTTY
jgi:uncharacterized Zn-finger protein